MEKQLPPARPCFHCGHTAWSWAEQPVMWSFPNWQCAYCYPGVGAFVHQQQQKPVAAEDRQAFEALLGDVQIELW